MITVTNEIGRNEMAKIAALPWTMAAITLAMRVHLNLDSTARLVPELHAEISGVTKFMIALMKAGSIAGTLLEVTNFIIDLLVTEHKA